MVLVAHGRPGSLDLLRRRVARIPGVTRVEGAGNGRAVLACYRELRPDLVLLAAALPGMDGLETTRRLLAAHPDAVVVVLATVSGQLTEAATSGAWGYLLDGVTHEDLCATLAHVLDRAGRRARAGGGAGLSARELQVLRGMAQGQSNIAIGKDLYLSEDTIKTHARRLFRKLGAGDRAQAVAIGFRQGLLD